MKKTLKKRGQKIARKWERFSERAREGSREHIQENIISRLPHARRVRLLILEWVLLIIVITSLALTQAFWYGQSYSVQAFVDGGTISKRPSVISTRLIHFLRPRIARKSFHVSCSPRSPLLTIRAIRV